MAISRFSAVGVLLSLFCCHGHRAYSRQSRHSCAIAAGYWWNPVFRVLLAMKSTKTAMI
jgi:hypothetical protein